MWKNKYFIISIIIAVILVGSTAGMVVAQDNQNPGKPDLLARVAQLLGINQQKLEDAFKQATQEQRQNGLDQMLQKWVDAGKLTKDQATQYKSWLNSRPDVPIPFRGDMFFTKDMDTVLKKLVDDGKITQDQATKYKNWINSKPNIELPKPDRPEGRPFNKTNQVPPKKTTT